MRTSCVGRAETAIVFEDVTKRYGSVYALAGVSIGIERGEMVALLGPNGAGKSTMVDLMLGLRRPDAGTVRILGSAAQRAVEHGRVGAMLQSGSLPERATVAEVVDLARRLYRSRRSLAMLLDLAALGDLAGRRVDRLSGGQARRVQLTVALAGDPDVLFLDEPTTGLDVQSRRLFWEGVRKVAAAGATVVFATHYLDEADANANRVVVLAGGKVVADGGPASIKAHLTNRIVRATLDPVRMGDIRALPGVLRASSDGNDVELVTADVDLTLEGLYRSCGTKVRNLRFEGSSLEDALVQLTSPPEGILERTDT
jgi:ABC-2 type transport system ATP-binding protein